MITESDKPEPATTAGSALDIYGLRSARSLIAAMRKEMASDPAVRRRHVWMWLANRTPWWQRRKRQRRIAAWAAAMRDFHRFGQDSDIMAARAEPAEIPPDRQLYWGVREPEGNVVTIEFTCHDAYEAIELAEVCAAALAEGELTIEVSNPPSRQNTGTTDAS